MNLNINTPLLALLAFPLAANALGAAPSQERRSERVRWVMGTLCELDAPGAPEAAVSAAFAELERWDRILSTYKKESDASALNRAAGAGPVKVSADLYAAVEEALRLARETGGAFDPTRSPAGWAKVRLDAAARTIELPAGMSLDFGGIGKGRALDFAAAVLRKAGVTRARFNFGGQVLALGEWPVMIPGRAEPLLLNDASVAVSGDAERPGHIISPFDGAPVRRPGAVAAVLPGAAEADAWSTALFVLGKAPPSFRGRSFFEEDNKTAVTAKGGRS
ncbi:MAG: FAD:protein FMN transferase [Elusimicrobiota bacterium]|nr:FAD:protein FMN transferase [Elusimicrobiota bacterium]